MLNSYIELNVPSDTNKGIHVQVDVYSYINLLIPTISFALLCYKKNSKIAFEVNFVCLKPKVFVDCSGFRGNFYEMPVYALQNFPVGTRTDT